MTDERENVVPVSRRGNAPSGRVTQTLLEHIVPISESCGAEAIFVCIDALDGTPIPIGGSSKPKVFYVTRKVVESCGTYLKTASQEEFELPRGLGSRHHAAAAITAVTDSIAVTVSASTGTVTIFRGGSIITEIEKPRSLGERTPVALALEPTVLQEPKLARKAKNKKAT